MIMSALGNSCDNDGKSRSPRRKCVGEWGCVGTPEHFPAQTLHIGFIHEHLLGTDDQARQLGQAMSTNGSRTIGIPLVHPRNHGEIEDENKGWQSSLVKQSASIGNKPASIPLLSLQKAQQNGVFLRILLRIKNIPCNNSATWRWSYFVKSMTWLRPATKRNTHTENCRRGTSLVAAQRILGPENENWPDQSSDFQPSGVSPRHFRFSGWHKQP